MASKWPSENLIEIPLWHDDLSNSSVNSELNYASPLHVVVMAKRHCKCSGVKIDMLMKQQISVKNQSKVKEGVFTYSL